MKNRVSMGRSMWPSFGRINPIFLPDMRISPRYRSVSKMRKIASERNMWSSGNQERGSGGSLMKSHWRNGSKLIFRNLRFLHFSRCTIRYGYSMSWALPNLAWTLLWVGRIICVKIDGSDRKFAFLLFSSIRQPFYRPSTTVLDIFVTVAKSDHICEDDPNWTKASWNGEKLNFGINCFCILFPRGGHFIRQGPAGSGQPSPGPSP